MQVIIRVCLVSTMMISNMAFARQQQPQPSSAPPQAQPAVEEWADDFGGDSLNETMWERFSFEGGSGRVKVEEGQLRQRGTSGSRSGVRSKPMFVSDRFIVEATLAKVAAPLPEPGDRGAAIGNAIVAVIFDGSGRNRIEWLLTSEGTFEAWVVVDGRGERLDNRKLATKTPNPTLGIVRRGDEFFFMLNGQAGLQKTIKNIPRSFHVMIYGFGSSENNWDSVRVVVAK